MNSFLLPTSPQMWQFKIKMKKNVEKNFVTVFYHAILFYFVTLFSFWVCWSKDTFNKYLLWLKPSVKMIFNKKIQNLHSQAQKVILMNFPNRSVSQLYLGQLPSWMSWYRRSSIFSWRWRMHSHFCTVHVNFW